MKLQETVSTITVVDKGMIPFDPESIGIQLFVTVENLDTLNACNVHIWPKRCCLLNIGKKDCFTVTVYGVNHKTVQPKDIETLILVYPAIYKYNHVGYCNLLLESDCSSKKLKREIIYLPFNTTNITDCSRSIFRKTESCDTEDQDPSNGCLPINCDEKYLGLRPFYSIDNRCTEAPVCERDFAKDLPDVVYVPNSNTCRDLDNPISVGDVYSFSTGLGVVTQNETMKTTTVELNSNLSTISQNLLFLKDLMYGKLCPATNNVSINYSEPCKSALWAIFGCIFGLVAVLLSFVCCINTSVWIYNKWSTGDLRNFFIKVKSKFFSNRLKCEAKVSKVNKDVKNKLLQDVIVTDLPIELRESAINLCERIGKEVKWKKRYRADAVPIILKNETLTSSESSTDTYDENN
ncbi:hypothetical protein K1T71_006944 [Dendrolimus kikuchii]|uniref:Uncharacterized protein n=1 Tax=Dendrolimus kikuchii TaxID=765133 RepID=A0ACC1CZE3_9NEOP|nr:hypothetical protein K1T71_006944 [Dendrolimus kikuchii]